MSEAIKKLAYRYRLRLTPVQEGVLDNSQEQLRLVWNHFVRSQHHAEHEWRNGRAASIQNELLELSLAKKTSGMAITSAKKLAEERNVPFEAALEIKRREFVEKTALIPRDKKTNARLRWVTRRRMAVAYADALVNSKFDQYFGLRKGIYQRLRKKFEESSKRWLEGTFKRPRFKRKGDPVALQTQIFDGRFTLNKFSDLSALGGQALEKCEVIIHRPLPESAVIKQIAVAGKKGARHLILMFDAVTSDVAKNFPTTNRTAGVDAGIKVALTIVPLDSPDFGKSDKIEKQPELAKDTRFLKRLRRLQRKHDRQRRKNNPGCFDEKGRWIKGKRANVESNNMKQVQNRITRMHTHLADSRRDFYHRAANEILRSFDNVAVGSWRPRHTRQTKPKTPSPKGLGAARRAVNRISYDHAISLFISYLKDKAARSTTPKTVPDVCEAYTTRTCPKCGKPTGPSGKKDLDLRNWTCGECGTSFDRDAAAAWQIAKKFSAEVASTSQPVESQDSANSASGANAGH